MFQVLHAMCFGSPRNVSQGFHARVCSAAHFKVPSTRFGGFRSLFWGRRSEFGEFPYRLLMVPQTEYHIFHGTWFAVKGGHKCGEETVF